MRFVVSCWVCLLVGLTASANPADADLGVVRVDSPRFQIAVEVEPTRSPGAVKELQLNVSADAGATWRQVASLPPGGNAFRFSAPRAGLYWFTVRVVMADGRAEPNDVSAQPAMLKVQVGAVGPGGKVGEAARDLTSEVQSLRQQLRKIEQRLSEIEKATGK